MFDELWNTVWRRVDTEWRGMKSAPVTIAALLLIGLMAGYQGAAWRYGGVIDSLTTDNTSLRYRIDHSTQPVAQPEKDPEGIYQLGSKVGRVIGAVPDLANGRFHFSMLDATGDFNQQKSFSYQGYVMKIAHSGTSSLTGTGPLIRSQTYSGVDAEIIQKE